MATATTLAAFRAAVAQEIAAIEQEQSADTSVVKLGLQRAGIAADVTPTDSSKYAVTVTNDATALPLGTKRSDFTDEALAAIDATFLNGEKERIWRYLCFQGKHGHYDPERVVQALETLGYTSLPTESTKVTFYVSLNWANQYGERSRDSAAFTLPGKVSHSDVAAALEAVATPSVATAIAQAAYPEATGLATTVENLSVMAHRVWPQHSEFWTDPDVS